MNQQVLDYIVSYALPLTTVGLGVIMGWIFKKFIHHRIKKLTERTEWKGDDVIFEAISLICESFRLVFVVCAIFVSICFISLVI